MSLILSSFKGKWFGIPFLSQTKGIELNSLVSLLQNSFEIVCWFSSRLDKEIIYTDKKDYQIAIGYQNDIFRDGLKATVAGDHSISYLSVDEGPKQSDSADMAAKGEMTNVINTTNSPNYFDDEESIDQNTITEEYQNEANGKVR